jgi:hypothetical protein
MPTLRISVTNVTPTGAGQGTATYAKQGGPGSVASDGLINLAGINATADYEIEFEMDDSDYEFDIPGFSVAMVSPFGPPVISPNKNDCTVPDDNAEAAYKYTLHLKEKATNATVDLDPRLINK